MLTKLVGSERRTASYEIHGVMSLISEVEMSSFICPVCGGALSGDGRSLRCAMNHSFDTARSGYTNLLPPRQSKTGQHGDDKVMVRSRQSFLDKGYYAPLLSALCAIVLKYARDGGRILDAG